MKKLSAFGRQLANMHVLAVIVSAMLIISSCSTKYVETPSPSSLPQVTQSKATPATSPGTLVATVDVNGDGIADNIYNNGSSVVVVRSTGVTDTYFISSGNWSIVPSAIADLDGVAGAEITVIVGQNVEVITDKKGTVTNYVISSGNWSVVPSATTDLDGVAGAELVVIAGNYVKIITQRTGVVTSYSISAGNWSIITQGSNGVSDMDGVAGAEIAIANGTYLTILCQRTGTLTNYSISSGNWSLFSNGIQNFDGKPGNDIALSIFSSSNIEIVHPKTGTITTYSSNTFGTVWNFVSYSNNSPSGININIYSTTRNRNYTIIDANGTIQAD